MNTSGDFVVETDGLRKQYGAVVAVRNLTLSIPRGGVFGLLGPNGSGKTTTIGALLGLIKPTAGSIRLFGQDVRGAHHATLHRVGAMVESPAFYPDLSGRANLKFFQGIGRPADDARIAELLAMVGLAERADSSYRTYSLGMKQRLGIAYALLGRPELVILDEPTNGLDPSGMAEVRELIQRLAAAGHTIVLCSHLLHEVEQVCEDVAILSRGELIAQGKVRELLNVQGSVRLKSTDDARAAAILGALDWVAAVRGESGFLAVNAPAECSGELTRALSEHGVYVTEMVPVRVTLENYFLQVTEAAAGAGH